MYSVVSVGCSGHIELNIEAWMKWLTFCRCIFQCIFLERKNVFWFRFYQLTSPLCCIICTSKSGQIMACRLFGGKSLSELMLGLLSIGPLGTNFSEIKIQNFSFMKMHLKILSVKWQLFRPGRDELKSYWHLTHKHRETHGCLVSTVATDALVLKHQAISIHNSD